MLAYSMPEFHACYWSLQRATSSELAMVIRKKTGPGASTVRAAAGVLDNAVGATYDGQIPLSGIFPTPVSNVFASAAPDSVLRESPTKAVVASLSTGADDAAPAPSPSKHLPILQLEARLAKLEESNADLHRLCVAQQQTSQVCKGTGSSIVLDEYVSVLYHAGPRIHSASRMHATQNISS